MTQESERIAIVQDWAAELLTSTRSLDDVTEAKILLAKLSAHDEASIDGDADPWARLGRFLADRMPGFISGVDVGYLAHGGRWIELRNGNDGAKFRGEGPDLPSALSAALDKAGATK